MTWFKVDDSLHSNPKVLATEPAALGLWVIAGSWSSASLTEGFVPDHVLPRLLPDAATLAAKLVATGLWKRTRGGYQFHDWLDYNPSKETVLTERKTNSDRQKRWREARRNGVTDGVTDAVTAPVSNAPPSRPVPSLKGGSSLGVTTDRARASPEPPPRCPEHIGVDRPPPCGACADARRAADRWRAGRDARVDAEPRCDLHPGEIAANCRSCAAEAKGAA